MFLPDFLMINSFADYFSINGYRFAMKYFQEFLKAAPPGLAEVPTARERVNILENSSAF